VDGGSLNTISRTGDMDVDVFLLFLLVFREYVLGV